MTCYKLIVSKILLFNPFYPKDIAKVQ